MPTVAESGLPGYEAATWFALFAPAGTARDSINRINEAITRTVGTVDMKAKILEQGADPVTGTPEQVRAFVKSEVAKWGRVVRDVGIKLE